MNLYLTYESRDTIKSFTLVFFVKTKLNMEPSGKIRNVNLKIIRCGSRSPSRQRRIWSFHVVVLPSMAKKCSKNYNTRAQSLYCSSTLLFSDIAVAVVVFSNSKPYPWQIVDP